MLTPAVLVLMDELTVDKLEDIWLLLVLTPAVLVLIDEETVDKLEDI